MAKLDEVKPPKAKKGMCPLRSSLAQAHSHTYTGYLGPSRGVQLYLIAYNTASAAGWTYILVKTLVHLTNLDGSTSSPTFLRSLLNSPTQWEAYVPALLRPLIRRASTTADVVGTSTAIIQSFAVLEIVHTLVGWVKSPLGATLAQVASRLNIVLHLYQFFPAVSACVIARAPA